MIAKFFFLIVEGFGTSYSVLDNVVCNSEDVTGQGRGLQEGPCCGLSRGILVMQQTALGTLLVIFSQKRSLLRGLATSLTRIESTEAISAFDT